MNTKELVIDKQVEPINPADIDWNNATIKGTLDVSNNSGITILNTSPLTVAPMVYLSTTKLVFDTSNRGTIYSRLKAILNFIITGRLEL